MKLVYEAISFMCVCVCVCAERERERERESGGGGIQLYPGLSILDMNMIQIWLLLWSICTI